MHTQTYFYIAKATRDISEDPYSGPSCDDVGVIKGFLYETIEEARIDRDKLMQCNPVGFNIVKVECVE